MTIIEKIKKIQELAKELEKAIEFNRTPLETYVNRGRIGGNSTKERLKDDPEYYKRIGAMGGKKNKRILE